MLKRKLFLKSLVLVCACPFILCAQNSSYVRIKEKPVVHFEFECAKRSLYPRTQLRRLVRTLLTHEENPFQHGNRAFAFDLNGDNSKEYFVPLGCTGIRDNCQWGGGALFSRLDF